MGASAVQIDFSNVKDGGAFNRNRIPAGDYAAKIVKVEDAKAKDDVAQLLFSIKIEGRATAVFPYYCKLQENQLWKLRNIFIAAGKNIPKKRVKVDPNQIVGKIIGVSIEDDEYEGKEQSNIAGVFPASDLDDSALADPEPEPEEDEDEPLEDVDADEAAPADDEEEAEEEPEDEPYVAMTRAELKAEIKKLDPDFVAKKSQSDDDLREVLRGLASAVTEGAPDTTDDEDEEEEAPAPAPKAAVKKKAPAKKPAASVTDDELEELDIDDL